MFYTAASFSHLQTQSSIIILMSEILMSLSNQANSMLSYMFSLSFCHTSAASHHSFSTKGVSHVLPLSICWQAVWVDFLVPLTFNLLHAAFSVLSCFLCDFSCYTFPSAIHHVLLSLRGTLCAPLLWCMSPECLLDASQYSGSTSTGWRGDADGASVSQVVSIHLSRLPSMKLRCSAWKD